MGLFGSKRAPVNLGIELRVELHNHVLPGLDDGAKSMEEAIQMLFFWVEMGYQKVIATPHHSSYFPTQDAEIEDKLLRLRYQSQEQELPIQITAAAEYLLEEPLISQERPLRFFGSQRYLLIEFGFGFLPIGWDQACFTLQQRGYMIVIAHPERYAYANREVLRRWYETGFFLQVNLLSLSGYYGRIEKEKAEYLLEKGWVHFLGSDLHKPHQIPYLREALKSTLLRKRMDKLLNPTLV
jgi:tyrosine-protein phosphatase YwqE